MELLAKLIGGLNLFVCLSINLSLTAPGRAAESDDQRVEKILGQMTLEEKLDYIGGVNAMSIRPIPRLGLPEIRMSDGPLGVRQDEPSTRYPAGIALAASWNRDLAQWEGVSMARDCRARGIHVLLAPGRKHQSTADLRQKFRVYLRRRSLFGVGNGRAIHSRRSEPGCHRDRKAFRSKQSGNQSPEHQRNRNGKSLARDLFAGVRGSCASRKSRCGNGCLQQSERRLLYGEQFSQ